MPIKYNLTKYDLLAEEIHELSQKRNTPFTKDEETLKAEAVILVSFASSHSWHTSTVLISGNPNEFSSAQVKGEYALASKENWKHVRNTDIQEVSCANVRDTLFYMWMSTNVERQDRDLFVDAWGRLKQMFNEECDGITVQRNNM